MTWVTLATDASMSRAPKARPCINSLGVKPPRRLLSYVSDAPHLAHAKTVQSCNVDNVLVHTHASTALQIQSRLSPEQRLLCVDDHGPAPDRMRLLCEYLCVLGTAVDVILVGFSHGTCATRLDLPNLRVVQEHGSLSKALLCTKGGGGGRFHSTKDWAHRCVGRPNTLVVRCYSSRAVSSSMNESFLSEASGFQQPLLFQPQYRVKFRGRKRSKVSPTHTLYRIMTQWLIRMCGELRGTSTMARTPLVALQFARVRAMYTRDPSRISDRRTSPYYCNAIHVASR